MLAQIRETLNLPDYEIVVYVDRQLTTEDGKVVLDDTRYFITSLDPERVCACDIHLHVRNH